MVKKVRLEEKTMSPLILLFRLGLENYMPHEHNQPRDNNYTFLEDFRTHLSDHLWDEKEKITPNNFYDIVEFVSHEQADKMRNRPTEKNYLAKILQNAVFEWIPEIDLGEWGEDVRRIYHKNMFNRSPSAEYQEEESVYIK